MDAVVVGERLRCFGRAAAREIGRTGAERVVDMDEPPADQRRRDERPAADRGVESFRDEVDDALGELEIQPDLRVGLGEVDGQRRDPAMADRGRRGDPEPAAGSRIGGADLAVQALDLLEDGGGARQVARSGLGRADLPRGPAQQRDPEHPLELTDMTADGGRRHAQPARRGREPAGSRDFHEDGHGRVCVHVLVPIIGKDYC